MFLITFGRIGKMAIVSLWRNLWLSLAAILMMILTLLTISFFINLLLITDQTTTSLRGKVDMSVYFQDSATKDQIFALQNILLSRSDIKSVDYISKEKALEVWRERNAANEKIRDVITEADNPLPRSIEIKTERPEDLENIYNLLNSNDYQDMIKEISYRQNKKLIDRLVGISNFIKLIGWGMSAIFVLISILIIYNTIRLTIFARSEEIDIMKLVGASDWYIRGPFVIEGVSYGVIGAILASIVFYFALHFTSPMVQTYLSFADINATFQLGFWLIFGIQLVVGFLLGVACSYLAIRKYLK